MRPPFPSAAQAYAESIDSATASRHHPDARLTILPLPSLAALYPLDSHPSTSHNSSSSSNHDDTIADSSHRNLQVRLLHRNHQQQPAYQSYDNHFQKLPTPLTNRRPSMAAMKQNSHEYLGASMESLLDAIEVHPALSSSPSPSRSPSPSGSSNSLSSVPTSPLSSPQTSALTANHVKYMFDKPAKAQTTKANSNKGRMSISNLVDSNQCENTIEDNKRPRLKPMTPKASSPTFTATDINKRKWSNLSSANFEEERNAKIR
ncbi:hypothetical protein BGZ52_002499, partial [Haplosporangium bisporale]